MAQSVDDFLSHNGVKGMKWGVRKSDKNKAKVAARTRSSAPREVSEDSARSKQAHSKAKSSGLDSLSNKEIQDYVTRTNLEQQYGKLNPAKTSAGKKFATGVVANTGKQLASQYASQAAKSGIDALIKVATSK